MTTASPGPFSSARIQLLLGLLGVAIVAGLAVWIVYSRSQFRSETSLLVDTLGIKSGMVVAEIGAGDGRMTMEMASRVGPAGHVFSTEIDPERIDEITKAVQQAGLRNVTVIKGAAGDTGLAENCCDAIFMRRVYHHLTQPSRIDKSVWNALRPGGEFSIIDFSPKRLLWPWKPRDVPENRGGHGIPPGVVVSEVTGADFVLLRVIPDWPGGSYCLLFRKPTQILLTKFHPAYH